MTEDFIYRKAADSFECSYLPRSDEFFVSVENLLAGGHIALPRDQAALLRDFLTTLLDAPVDSTKNASHADEHEKRPV